MNKVILMGRLTRDPDVRYSQNSNQMAIARYSLAVDRRFKRDGEPDADVINCVAFGKSGEFAEKYFRKGMRVVVTGRIQTGSYTNRDGQRVYTTDVVVEDQEFAESKAASDRNAADYNSNNSYGGNNYGGGSSYQQPARPMPSQAPADGFMNIPEGIDEELPFS